MVWTDAHEILYQYKDIYQYDLYQYKDLYTSIKIFISMIFTNIKITQENLVNCLDRISESLNAVPTLWFKVHQRALRDKVTKHSKDFISKRNKEERDTGISPEHRELDDLL